MTSNFRFFLAIGIALVVPVAMAIGVWLDPNSYFSWGG